MNNRKYGNHENGEWNLYEQDTENATLATAARNALLDLLDRIEELERASKCLVETLDKIGDHPSFKAMESLAFVHGHRYTGPSWKEARNNLADLLGLESEASDD